METYDYSWDGSSADEEVDGSAIPRRFALTAPQVVMRGSGEILLIDPHAAGTWETWMFPYASLVLDDDEVRSALAVHGIADHPTLGLATGLTLHGLAGALGRLRTDLRVEYDKAIADGVNNVIPHLIEKKEPRSFYENYSLKYSKSSNSYTAYDFEYFLNRWEPEDLRVPHIWVDPAEVVALTGDVLRGKAISSNVVEAAPAILEL
jgi:hypothetical protein